MELEEARALVREHTQKETTVRHLISVEGVMRALARRLDGDQELWALTGLFHDLDQDVTGEDLSRHARLAAEWLRVAGALVRPEKSAGMKVSSVKKKLKERAFAPGVNRDEITQAPEVLGLDLDEFFAVAIEGLQQVAPDIDL